jgi:hypothetical protein
MKSTRKKSAADVGDAKQVGPGEAKPRTFSHSKRGDAMTADAIATLADNGKDVSRYFTNKGRMMEPIQRVNVDFTAPMLQELDNAARELNISRQAVIKTLLRQALDQHYLAAAHQVTNAPGPGIRRA